MREIKFRAKYKDAEGWTYSNPKRMSVFWKDEEDGFYSPETITQFTGLLDKNGKEIYKGDIVKIDDKRLLEIFFVGGAFGMTAMDFSVRATFFTMITQEEDFLKRVEVIGNIWEHKHLLDKVRSEG